MRVEVFICHVDALGKKWRESARTPTREAFVRQRLRNRNLFAFVERDYYPF